MSLVSEAYASEESFVTPTAYTEGCFSCKLIQETCVYLRELTPSRRLNTHVCGVEDLNILNITL